MFESKENDLADQQYLYSQISVNKHVLEEPVWETVVSLTFSKGIRESYLTSE